MTADSRPDASNGSIAAMNVPDRTHFPLYRFSGSHTDIGRGYGTAAREALQHRAEELPTEIAARSGRSLDDLQHQLDLFSEQYQRYAPHVLDEIRGIAAGAGIEPETALLFRCRWDVLATAAGRGSGCTSFVVAPEATASGGMIGGQNKDVPPRQLDDVVVTAFAPDDGRPAMLNYAYLGMAEGPGLNSAGLIKFENAIWAGRERSAAIPVHLLKRLFQESVSIAECVDWAERIRGDGLLGMTANMTLGDATGRLASLEIVPGDFRLWEPSGAIMAHANHLMHPDLAPLDRVDEQRAWIDSRTRQPRMQELLEQDDQRLDTDLARRALADRANPPGSICRITDESMTVAGVICEPAIGRLHISYGPPSEGRWAVHDLQPS